MPTDEIGSLENYNSSNYNVLCSWKIDYLLCHAPDEVESFRDAPIIVTKKWIRDAINLRKVSMFSDTHHRTLNLYRSKDSSQKSDLPLQYHHLVWGLNSTIMNDMLGELPLCVGMPVMITENVSIMCGIVNGMQGVVDSISYS